MRLEIIKRCSDCGKFLGENSFYYRNKDKNIRQPYCKRCALNRFYLWKFDNKEQYFKYHNHYSKQYRKNNKEKCRIYDKQWCENNRNKKNIIELRRLSKKLKQAPELNDSEKQKLDLYYIVCNEMGKNFEVDHIKPLSKGGLHHPDNLQILSKKLNREKRDKYPLSKAEKIKFSGITL